MKRAGSLIKGALKGHRFFGNHGGVKEVFKKNALWTQTGTMSEIRSLMQMASWEDFTVRGKDIREFNLFELIYNHSNYNFVSRGQNKKEALDPVNIALSGLVANRSPVKFKQDGTVDTEETERLLNQHRKGNIHGVSTTRNIKIALSFSCYLDKNHEIVLVDRLSIPMEHQHIQIYDPSKAEIGFDGEPLTYSHENELTVTGVPTSSIMARVIRQGILNFQFYQNPLYVDPLTLSGRLKTEFTAVTHQFFKLAVIVRENPESHKRKIEEYQEQRKAFYQDYSRDMGFDELRRNAILSELGIDLDIQGPENNSFGS